MDPPEGEDPTPYRLARARAAWFRDDPSAVEPVLEKRPEIAPVHFLRGLVQADRAGAVSPDTPAARERAATALAEFDAALKLDPQFADAAVHRAYLLDAAVPAEVQPAKTREHAEAVRKAADAGLRALKLRPTAQVLPRVVARLGEAGRHAEVVALLTALDPTAPDYLPLLSRFIEPLIACGELRRAEVEARNGIATDAKIATFHFLLGRALMTQGRYADAEAELRQAVGSDAADPAFWRELGFCLYQQGKFDAAKTHLDSYKESLKGEVDQTTKNVIENCGYLPTVGDQTLTDIVRGDKPTPSKDEPPPAVDADRELRRLALLCLVRRRYRDAVVLYDRATLSTRIAPAAHALPSSLPPSRQTTVRPVGSGSRDWGGSE